MNLTESIVEDAALEWFGEQFRCAPTLIPAFSQGEKENRGAIRWLNPAFPEEVNPQGILVGSKHIERSLNQ